MIQLFALMFIFDLGTALIVSYGIPAKKDAWLAVILGIGGGILLFFTLFMLVISIIRNYVKKKTH